MGRILALDYGIKRTGLAWTDPLKIVATGLESIDTSLLKDRMKTLLGEEKIEMIVLGLAQKADGSDTNSTQYIREFGAWLEKTFPNCELVYWDESFSSKKAIKAMIEAGVPKKKRSDKYLINQVSATLILQDYLNNNII